MELILLAVVVSVALLVFSFMQRRKKQAVITELMENNDFQVYDYSKRFLMFMAVFAVLSVILSYFAFAEGQNTGIALSIILLTMVIGEPLINIGTMKFYYNDTSCIVQDKLIRYKSVKEFRPKAFSPVKQKELITLNGEKYTVDKDVAEIIQNKMNERVEEKAKAEEEKKTKKTPAKKKADSKATDKPKKTTKKTTKKKTNKAE